jgi:methyl-accepting chemotaxis protein
MSDIELRPRLMDRVGIIPRLLLCALLAILLAVSSAQLLTLRSVQKNGMQQAEHALEASMAVLRHELAALGTEWRTTQEGALLLGTSSLNGRNDLVDTVQELTGASATIFLGDARIATNVKNQDGSRGIGTRLAAGAAHDALFRDHAAYTGFTTILSAPYLARYEPIRDAQGATIGATFVGVPVAEAEAFVTRTGGEALIGALATLLITGLGYLWALTRTVRPLRDLTAVMHRVAEGELDAAVPCTRRSDQIGWMARALEQLRAAAAHARSLEEQATARADIGAEKLRELAVVVDRIEAETTAAINNVGARTAAMTETAEKMAASATSTGFSAASAANVSAQVLENAHTVAAAAEHLSAAIQQISSQVDHSTEIVGRAVTAGSNTQSTIEALSQKVARVGAVADMIGAIAAKTNLL